MKYPHLIRTSSSPKPASKRRRGGRNTNKKSDKVKDNETAYFAANELISFIANNSSTSLCVPNTWVWDCSCSQYSTPNCSLFLEYRTLGKNQKAIQGLTGSVIPIEVETIELVCNTPTSLQLLTFHNVLHIPGTSAHLLSQGQIYKEDYALTINSGGIKIRTTGVITKLMSRNLYLITTFPYTTLSFSAYAALNPHMVDMWYLRLSHLEKQNVVKLAGILGKQNIVKLAGMSDGIDLTIPLPLDACIPCARGTLQVKLHNDSPILGQKKLDLIHSDIIGPFPSTINGARYVVSFLDDDTKESEVSFFKRKSEVLQAF